MRCVLPVLLVLTVLEHLPVGSAFFVRADVIIDADTLLDSGSSHVVGETVRIVDGVDPPTIVDVRDGAEMSALIAEDISIVNMHGGFFEEGAFMHDSSVLNFFGGEFLPVSPGVVMRDFSAINVFDGDLELNVADSSTANIMGGMTRLRLPCIPCSPAAPPRTVNVFDGQVQFVESMSVGRVNVMGGHFVTSRMTVKNFARAHMHAGLFDMDIESFGSALPYLDDGTVFIYGGTFSRRLLASGGVFHVFGDGLQIAGDRLTGTLSDGTPIDVPVVIEFDGRFFLHEIPEPSSSLLLLLGLAILLQLMWTQARGQGATLFATR